MHGIHQTKMSTKSKIALELSIEDSRVALRQGRRPENEHLIPSVIVSEMLSVLEIGETKSMW